MLRILVLLPILLIVASSSRLPAQTFSEWFKQKKTQKKYLLAQIAALETYTLALEKGYQLAKSGLGTIGHLKESNFLQHQLHFNTLTMVGPEVKNNPRVAAIAAMQDKSAGIRGRLLARKDLKQWLTKKENAELRQFNSQASAEAAKDLETLELLVSDRTLQMSTAERLQHIETLYALVKEKYSTVVGITRRTAALLQSRKDQGKATEWLKELYGR